MPTDPGIRAHVEVYGFARVHHGACRFASSVETVTTGCALLVFAFALVACGTRTDNLASSRELDDDAGPALDAGDDADAEDAGDAGPGWSLNEAGVAYCGNSACACSNGMDDDRDGLTDGLDPECTSASDQYEDSFATGVHGEDREQKCQDCFFDGNSGRGDGCRRASECAVGMQPTGNGACGTCEISASCVAACQPLVPNGCDCFGCCGVWRPDRTQVHVLLRSTCSLAVLDNAELCPPCSPARECENPCGECELCPGRTEADLPASCGQGGTPYRCDDAELCTPGSCRLGQYCQQGCCMEIPL